MPLSSAFRALCVLLGVAAACPTSASAATPATPPPNVVLLMGDDHGWEETGYNGHPYLKTPVLDEMARTGLRLDRFYAATPICSPTRGSVMTGRHPNRYGTFTPGWSIRPEEITIAQLLRDGGYATAHFGKWHLGPVKAASPTNPGAMGFETWLSHDNFFEMNPHFSRNGAPPQVFTGESSEILVAEAIRAIDAAKARHQPFFIVIWFGSPHEPYSGTEADLKLYDTLPADFGQRQVRLTSNETGEVVERRQRDVLRERFAEITAMDRSIGQLRTHLRATGLRDNTLLWYCGDNGTPQEANATVPFRGQKSDIYDGGLRVPGVVEWPAGIRTPRISDVMTVTSDILPTLAELANRPLPARPLDGISLTGLFAGRMTERPTPIFFWNGRPALLAGPEAKPYLDPELQKGTTSLVKRGPEGLTRNFRNAHYTRIQEKDFGGPRAMLEHRFKLVVDGERDSGVELFDIRQDPAEKTNLAARHPEVVRRMQAELRAWQESVLKSLTTADYGKR